MYKSCENYTQNTVVSEVYKQMKVGSKNVLEDISEHKRMQKKTVCREIVEEMSAL